MIKSFITKHDKTERNRMYYHTIKYHPIKFSHTSLLPLESQHHFSTVIAFHPVAADTAVKLHVIPFLMLFHWQAG